MMYGSWDREHNRHNFLSFWTVFCTFTPLWTQKIKIFIKMEKTPEDIIILKTYITVIWCMVPEIWYNWRTEFFVILDYFLHFYLLNNPKNQNFEKLKKASRDIIILHKCTKNYDHMLYCSWDMAHNGFNYFSFWAIFCPFTSLKAQKIKIRKK